MVTYETVFNTIEWTYKDRWVTLNKSYDSVYVGWETGVVSAHYMYSEAEAVLWLMQGQ